MNRLVHLILPLLLSAVAVIAVNGSWFSSLDYYLFDRIQSHNKVPSQDDVLIIAIDEFSTAQLGRWPWPRKRHAELLDVLTDAGVRVVVFDILFGEADLLQPANDIAFANAIERNGKVILPVYFESLSYQGQSVEIPPLERFAKHTAAIGHAHIDCSVSGICRSVYLKEGVGSPHWPHMALALHNVVENASKEKMQMEGSAPLPGLRAQQVEKYSPMLIYRDFKNFVPIISGGETPILSYSDVLKRRVPASVLKNKIIFVGATATGIHDVVVTPAGRMPGVKLNSFVYQAIRGDKLSHELGVGTASYITFFMVFVLLTIFSFLRPSHFFLLTLFSSAMIVVVSAFLLLKHNLWFPPSGAMVFLLLFYPLWSWVKIEFALRFLHRSLLRIQEEEESGDLVSVQNEQGDMLPSSERLSKILFGTHFSVESKLKGTEIVTKTIEQFRLANRGLESARQLVLQSLANLQEAVVIFNKSGSLVLKNKFAQSLFPGMSESFSVAELGHSLFLGESCSWSDIVAALSDNKKPVNIEGYCEIAEGGSDRVERVDLYIQGKNIDISRPSSNKESSSATTNILLFTFTDITTLKNSERSRMETMDFISHDLRSPMVSIIALIEKQRIMAGDSRTELQVLGEIEKYAIRSLSYAESLLHLSRAEVASADNYTTNDMHAVIDAAHAYAVPLAQQKNITMTVEREDVDMWVLADTDLIERALINLVTNAIKYSDAYTQIKISLATHDGVVEVHVCDQGPGIGEQDRSTLFQRFKRGMRKSAEGGAGLGLYFVETVVHKHGGTVSTHNNPTLGSTFIVSLPLIIPTA